MTTSNTEQLHEEAIAWLLRRNDPQQAELCQAEFDEWIGRSRAHVDADLDAEELWQQLEAPARQVAGTPVARAPVIPLPQRPRRRYAQWAMAAGLVVALGAGFSVWRDPGLAVRWQADAATAPGQSHELMLADGSTLYLDNDSAVRLKLDGEKRQVDLLRGRIWLSVNHDGRSFVVSSDGAEVEVLGTRFALERWADQLQVTVEQGRVAVTAPGGAHTPDDEPLTASQRISVNGQHLQQREQVNVDTALAWRRGEVVFDQAPIAQVARQLERMTPGRVLLDPTQFSGQRLSGSFPADRPELILRALEMTQQVEVTQLTGSLLWLQKRAP